MSTFSQGFLAKIRLLCQRFATIFQYSFLWPVENNDGGEGSETEHPEPEEDVDLLVEDVEREDAQRVVLLQLTRGPELVESALG
jgi:hypothetical protein